MAGARTRLMLAGSLVFLAAGAVAQEKETGVMDEQAIDIFKTMSAHLSEAETLSFTTSGLREVTGPSGIKYLHGRTGFVVVQRPDHIHARALRDDGQATEVWFDGESLTVAFSDAGDVRYATIAAPEGATTIDGMLDHLIEEYDFVLQLGDPVHLQLRVLGQQPGGRSRALHLRGADRCDRGGARRPAGGGRHIGRLTAPCGHPEYETHKVEVLLGRDSNHDGVLTLDETRLSPEAFDRLDTDADGQLSGSEVVLSDEFQFAQVDRNGDDALTLDEFRALVAELTE